MTGRSNYLFRGGRPLQRLGSIPSSQASLTPSKLSALMRDRGYPVPPIKCASRQIVTTVQCQIIITCINTIYFVIIIVVTCLFINVFTCYFILFYNISKLFILL